MDKIFSKCDLSYSDWVTDDSYRCMCKNSGEFGYDEDDVMSRCETCINEEYHKEKKNKDL